MKLFLILALTLAHTTISTAYGAISDYQAPELQARSNLNDTFNLPAMSFLTNNSPVISNRGDITFKVLSSEGPTQQGIWIKRFDDEAGKIYFNGPEERVIFGPAINAKGEIIFSMGDIGITDGIFIYDTNTDILDHRVKGTSEVESMTNAQMTSAGDVFFRVTNKNNERAFYSFNPEGDLTVLANEESSQSGVETSYLFQLVVNNKGSFAFKRRLGKKGDWGERNKDEIVLVKKNGTKLETIVIARDSDSDPTSIFKSFSNAVSLSDNDMVAFVAQLENGQNVLYLYKSGELTPLASDKNDQISEIEMFNPKLNNLGQVAFRAKDAAGLRAIFIAEINALKKVITEGDDMDSDRGPAKILSNKKFPGFSGSIDMNDHGDIVFNCILTDPDNASDWGSAIYKLSPIKK